MNNKAILEGLLYIVGDDGLSIDNIKNVLNISDEESKSLLTELSDDYDGDNHGIELAQFGEIFKFISKSSINEYVTALFALNKNATLSSSALETLAIIAYKQPITRIEIEAIRGVNCEMMLKKLISRNLIQENGRSDAPGRPYLYEVTQDFLDTFKLSSLKELPELPSYNNDDNKNLFDVE